jgi:hypothetical protein
LQSIAAFRKFPVAFFRLTAFFTRREALDDRPLLLTLFLFVFCVGADDPHDAFSADDLAVFTNTPDAASHFHD